MTVQVDRRLRPVPSSGCQQAVDGVGWTTTDLVRLDHVDLGVRTRDEPVNAALRALLGDRLLPDRPDAPPNFSLHTAEAPAALRGRSAGLSSVLRGCTTMHRARGAGEMLRAFIACLEDDYRTPGDRDLLINAVGLVHEAGHAALLPDVSRSLVYRNWVALEDAGWRVTPTMTTRFDDSRRLVVRPARVPSRAEGVPGLADLDVLRGVGHAAREGSYDVRMIFAAGRMGPDRATSRANAFLELWARTLSQWELGHHATFPAIAELVRGASIAAAPRHGTALVHALASGL
jgi:hypothetical protein